MFVAYEAVTIRYDTIPTIEKKLGSVLEFEKWEALLTEQLGRNKELSAIVFNMVENIRDSSRNHLIMPCAIIEENYNIAIDRDNMNIYWISKKY